VKYLIKIMLLSIWVFSGLAAGASDDAVLDLLQGYEWTLPDDRLRGMGPDVYKSLLAIADDVNQVHFIRARAALALTRFPVDEVWDFYEHEITTGQDAIRRRQSVQNICRSFLHRHPMKLESTLMPLLLESDAYLRSNSARCLQKFDTDRSRAALSSYRKTISESWELRAAGFNLKGDK
jgi:hypothetical protein